MTIHAPSVVTLRNERVSIVNACLTHCAGNQWRPLEQRRRTFQKIDGGSNIDCCSK
jgi:hypothetical protein